MRHMYHLRMKIMNEKEIKLLFSFTDDIGETAILEKTFNDCNEIGTLPWLLE